MKKTKKTKKTKKIKRRGRTGWTPAHTKPSGPDDVLLSFSTGSCQRQIVGWWSKGPQAWMVINHDSPNDLFITHWRELPPPPKARKK